MDTRIHILRELKESAELKLEPSEEMVMAAGRAAVAMVEALRAGKKVIWMGNGGSAADAQHLAAELVGKFLKERRALPSLSLATNTSALTAIGNDFGYDTLFSRQVEALAAPGDVLVGISTSGRSKNVLEAFRAGRAISTVNVALTGVNGLSEESLADIIIKVNSHKTPRIQEMHITLGHAICGIIEDEFDGGTL
jgi:D-sedoheptulose 7-phosphate isomerase